LIGKSAKVGCEGVRVRVRVRVDDDEDGDEVESVGSSSHCQPHPHLNAKQLSSGLALLVERQKKIK